MVRQPAVVSDGLAFPHRQRCNQRPWSVAMTGQIGRVRGSSHAAWRVVWVCYYRAPREPGHWFSRHPARFSRRSLLVPPPSRPLHESLLWRLCRWVAADGEKVRSALRGAPRGRGVDGGRDARTLNLIRAARRVFNVESTPIDWRLLLGSPWSVCSVPRSLRRGGSGVAEDRQQARR
jgi:hypothetical protein